MQNTACPGFADTVDLAGGEHGLQAYPLPNEVRVDPMFERKSRYRCAGLKAGCDETVFRCRLVSAPSIPTDKPYSQFLIIFCHHLVFTSFGGHLMPKHTRQKKVRGNSRLTQMLHGILRGNPFWGAKRLLVDKLAVVL